MQLQDVSFEQIFPLSELQIEVRNEEVWSFVVGGSFERGNDTRSSSFHNSLELLLGDMWKPVKTVGPDFRLKQNV